MIDFGTLKKYLIFIKFYFLKKNFILFKLKFIFSYREKISKTAIGGGLSSFSYNSLMKNPLNINSKVKSQQLANSSQNCFHILWYINLRLLANCKLQLKNNEKIKISSFRWHLLAFYAFSSYLVEFLAMLIKKTLNAVSLAVVLLLLLLPSCSCLH